MEVMRGKGEEERGKGGRGRGGRGRKGSRGVRRVKGEEPALSEAKG
jgi:hypothetical protein